MNVAEFRASVAADKAAREAAPAVKSCPLPDSATSDEMVACGCSDCMDRDLGREIEQHPVGAGRLRRIT